MKHILIALCLCVQASLAAQPPAFEVASLKPADKTLRGAHGYVEAAGIDFANIQLFEFIRRAYRVQPYQLIGPAWINTARYAITARAAGLAVGATPDATDPDAPPSFFTEIPQRLGLKLQAKKEPIDVLVIDHIEKPSGN